MRPAVKKIMTDELEEALRNLLRILDESPNQYAITLFRYEGRKNYNANFEVTRLEVGEL